MGVQVVTEVNWVGTSDGQRPIRDHVSFLRAVDSLVVNCHDNYSVDAIALVTTGHIAVIVSRGEAATVLTRAFIEGVSGEVRVF